MIAIDEKSRDHQSDYNSSLGWHESLYQISCQTIKLLSKLKNRNVNPMVALGEKSEVPQSQQIHYVGTMNTSFVANHQTLTEMFQSGPKWSH